MLLGNLTGVARPLSARGGWSAHGPAQSLLQREARIRRPLQSIQAPKETRQAM